MAVLGAVAALGLLVATLAPQAALAQSRVEPFDPLVRFQTVQDRGVSLRQAIALAQQRHRGRVVRAETKQMNGRRVHEIRILGDDGRVRTLHFDADDGGGR
jgi:uncharacterized membrane protein YkoI